LANNSECESQAVVFAANGTLCVIQKGISPNGDGSNDNFDLTGLNVRKLEIFNRYGKKVYSFSNYTNQWYGQSDNGNDLPTGTYYYVIERDNVASKSGWIYINR
jgi:gliding motility-associated-like protein